MIRPKIIAIPALVALMAFEPACSKDQPKEPSGDASPQVGVAKHEPPASNQDRNRAARLVAEARELAANHAYQAAKAKYARAAKLDPNNLEARSGLDIVIVDKAAAQEAARKVKHGKDLAFVGQKIAAWQEFHDASILDPNNAKAAEYAADMGLEIRRYQDSMDYFAKVLERDPQSLKAMINGSLAAYRAGDYGRCLEFLSDMNFITAKARKDPRLSKNLGEIWFMRGIAAREKDLMPDAIASLEKAVRHQPDSTRFQAYLAGSYLESGEFKLAIEAFKKLLEMDSNYPHAHFNLARAYDRSGDLKRAISHYRESLKRDKTQWLACMHMGRCYERLGGNDNLVEALSSLEEALRLNPLSHESMHSMQRVLRKLGRPDEAKLWGERYNKVRQLAQDQEEQLRALSKKIRKNPKDIQARLQALRIHEKFHHVKDAMREIRGLLNVDPYNREGLKRMAALLLVEKKFQDAYFEARKLIDVAPDDSAGWSLAATSLASLQRMDEATLYAEQAWDLNNEDVTALRILLSAWQKLPERAADVRRLMPIYKRLEAKERAELERLQAEERARKESLLKMDDEK
ncbi:MAG TPA: tetratricopeptide repeat protein [Planctomycetes bacterium]|nr:tetratricopeptide repeat protein [Planctomycetota bacterium]